jgi:hypothetical protein
MNPGPGPGQRILSVVAFYYRHDFFLRKRFKKNLYSTLQNPGGILS